MQIPAELDQDSSIVRRALLLRERMNLATRDADLSSGNKETETKLDWSKADIWSAGQTAHSCTSVPRSA